MSMEAESWDGAAWLDESRPMTDFNYVNQRLSDLRLGGNALSAAEMRIIAEGEATSDLVDLAENVYTDRMDTDAWTGVPTDDMRY